MRILFVGAGAVGTYVGGALAVAGHEVGFLEQPDAAAVLSERGLTLHRGAQAVHVTDARFFGDAAEGLDAAAWDVLVFALKSFDTEPVLRSLIATGRDLPPVLSLQNGVDNEPLIAHHLGSDRVVHGSVISAIGKTGFGEVVEEKRRGLGIALGHDLSLPLIDALNEAHLNAQPFRSAGSLKWTKLMTNLQGNAVSAILDLPTGAVMADDRLFDLEMDALAECLAVMRGLGFQPVHLPKTPTRSFAFAVEHLPRAAVQPILVRMLGDSRGHKMPSFHIDLHSGRGRTEVSFINGAVVRHGEQLGIPTPVNRVLTDTLEALSRGDRAVDDFRHAPEALLALLPKD